MDHNKKYDVAFIGNYTKDTIISPSGVQYVDGGAVNYAANAAARLGYKVVVITHLSREDDRVVQRLQRTGIDCLPTYTSQSTLMKLEYPTDDPDTRTLSVAATAGSIEVNEIIDLDARSAVIGTSLRGEVGLDVIRELHSKEMLVALDVQGFVRVLRGQHLAYEPWEEMQSTLAYVNILKSDAVEAEFLTGEKDIYRAAEFYARMGPQEIVLTHKDGVLFYDRGDFHPVEFHSLQLDGRSGRGDTCLGTYAAARLSKSPAEAGIWAAAVTSLKMEFPGPFNRSVAEVEDLINRKYVDGGNGHLIPL
jgi:sugar/nucleoside kinase (ribokinase family)